MIAINRVMSITPITDNAGLDIPVNIPSFPSPSPPSISSSSVEKLTIWSFNVARKWETMSITLERAAGSIDIILFQEPAWRGVRKQPSTTNKEGDVANSPPIHPSWTPFHEVFSPTDKSVI